MPQIFEVFGYPLTDQSTEAVQNRLNAHCPFMNGVCDGGGNRYASQIRLKNSAELAALYPEFEVIQSGVCSIQVQPDKSPWIVCPRRLLVLGAEKPGERKYQAGTEAETLNLLKYPVGTRLGVWAEVKMEYWEEIEIDREGEIEKQIAEVEYRFDYVVMPIGLASQSQIEEELEPVIRRLVKPLKSNQLRSLLIKSGYTLAYRGGEYFVEDYPLGYPGIIEIMTSSTSGGNQQKRTTVPMAFSDAILGIEHKAPGINYRQVWARMASQLIVKSEFGLKWGGKTIWVIQDVLAGYISATTALDLKNFIKNDTSEVNIISFSYGDSFVNPYGILELGNAELYAGPISSVAKEAPEYKPSFQDIIRSSICPPLAFLKFLLLKKRFANQILLS